MGSRLYAHTIARLLDPSGVFFADRIRSRDESFDMCSKYRDLRFVCVFSFIFIVVCILSLNLLGLCFHVMIPWCALLMIVKIYGIVHQI